jgi:hypothetical protein
MPKTPFFSLIKQGAEGFLQKNDPPKLVPVAKISLLFAKHDFS